MAESRLGNLSPKNMLLTVLLAVKAESIPAHDLIKVMGLLGVSRDQIQFTLNEFVQKGCLEVGSDANYRFSEKSALIRSHVNSWRLGESRKMNDWMGDWIICRLPDRAVSFALRQKSLWALKLLGFKSLYSRIWLHPNNLPGGMIHVSNKLYRLGLEPTSGLTIDNEFKDSTRNYLLDRETWAVSRFNQTYTHSCSELVQRTTALGKQPRSDDVIEGFIFGYRIIRQLIMDLLLPNEIQCPEPRSRLTDLLIDFEAKGRILWDKLVYDLKVS